MATLKTKILHRNDTTQNWKDANPTLSKGEFGIEWITASATGEEGACKVKVGDGFTAWNDLNYFGGDAIKITTSGSGNSVVSVTSSTDNLGVVTYTLGLGDRLTGSSLTANQVLLGNGGVAVKSSGKTIVTSIAGSDNLPTDKAVKTYVDSKVGGVTAGAIGALTNITVNDDDVMVLSVTKSGTTATITGSHAKKGPSAGYTSGNATNSISGSGATGTIKIPQITVDAYGHVTAAADEDVVITMPTLPTIPDVTASSTGTGNVITAISASGHAITATKGISVYTKDEVDKKIGDSGVKSVSVGDDNVVNLSVTMSAGAVTIIGTHTTGGANTSKGATADVSVAIGATGSIKVPYATVNTYGHTTTLKEQTLTIDLSNTYTKKDIDDKIGQQVASAVQYLGTVSAEAKLSVTAGKGDFYRSSASFVAASGKTIHSGDLIIAEKDSPTAKIDGTNWSSIHGEEVGVESITAGNAAIVIGGTSAQPTISHKTYTAQSITPTNEMIVCGLYTDGTGHVTSASYRTLGAASSTTAGIVKLGSDTQQTVAANAVSASANRTYAIQLNNSGQMVVNVPWSEGINSRDPGYGKITPSNSTAETAVTGNTIQVVATTYSEDVDFAAGNKWIVLAGTNSATAGSDKITWGHALSSLTAGSYGPTANVTGNDNSTIVIPQITTDAAGHITGITNRTLTLKNTADTNTWREIKVGNTSTGTSITGTALQLDATKGLKVEAAPGSTFKVTYSLDIDTLDGGSAADSGWGTVS